MLSLRSAASCMVSCTSGMSHYLLIPFGLLSVGHSVFFSGFSLPSCPRRNEKFFVYTALLWRFVLSSGSSCMWCYLSCPGFRLVVSHCRLSGFLVGPVLCLACGKLCRSSFASGIRLPAVGPSLLPGCPSSPALSPSSLALVPPIWPHFPFPSSQV